MKKLISIKEASIILGVCTTTLRRWQKSNKLVPTTRTMGGHRRYELSIILKIIEPNVKENRVNICYSRVSSYDQKQDLKRQSQLLLNHTKNLDNVELIEDLGSGLNFKKRSKKTHNNDYIIKNRHNISYS